MIFEWRTYRFAPGRATAYLAAFQSEGLPLVTRHLPLLGYWLTESGRLNVLHHLWVYTDLDDRTACRTKLAADADWTGGFGPRAFPIIEQQETLLLTLRTASPRLSQAISTAREVRPAATSDAPVLGKSWATLEITENATLAPAVGELVGAWQVVSGERPGSHFRLARNNTAPVIGSTPLGALRHELMRPTAFSPLL
jgi:hypothetical protein